MSLSYPLTFPSVGICEFALSFRKSIGFTESPFSYAQQVHDFGGAKWEAQITIPPLSQADAQTFQAFLIGLEGRKGTFTMGNPLHTSALSRTATGNKGDTDITFSGSVPAGTYFSIANKLYITTETGTTDVNIQPPLRANASSASVDFTQPLGTWRLSTNDVNWSTGKSRLTEFTFACVEAI
nr:hypothetical protein [uncultured Mediterranean phage uvMED]